MKIRDLLRLLRDDGWVLARTRGSHEQYRHPTKPGLVTVAGKSNDDIAPGTLNNILKAGGPQAMKLLVIVEPTTSGFSAFSPDVPGCIATGATREEVEAAIRDAIAFHLDGLREDGLPLPAPTSYALSVEVAA